GWLDASSAWRNTRAACAHGVGRSPHASRVSPAREYQRASAAQSLRAHTLTFPGKEREVRQLLTVRKEDIMRSDHRLRVVERRRVLPLLAALVVAGTGASGSAAVSAPVTWTFDSLHAGEPPAGFTFARTGSGRVGRWVVRAAADAPSAPNVLAQEDSDRTDYRFPLAIADGPTFGDVSVSVR